jgi:hypothetical protein
MTGSEQKWAVGDAVIVADPDSREYGHQGTITAITRKGDLSVRMDGWTYALFGPRQLGRVAPRPSPEPPVVADAPEPSVRKKGRRKRS